MKIASWNVNGIRSAETQFLEYLSTHSPDILFIQELRAFEDQLSFFLRAVPGYTPVFNPSIRPGYAGTASYIKDAVLKRALISTDCVDQLISEENRFIEIRIEEICLLNLYVPNGTSSEIRQEYKMRFLNKLLEYTLRLKESGLSVVLGGDINIAHTEKDLYNPAANFGHSGFLPEERKLLTKLISYGFVDSFRHFYQEGGHYTWWHMRDSKRILNRGWRFDYFFISRDLLPVLKSAAIQREVFGSDHCPICIELDV